MCVLRTLMDGDWYSGGNTQAVHCSERLIIDYLHTVEAYQGQGHASRLLESALDCARLVGANIFVLALEDSCPYWLSKGFVLEEGDINRRLNTFPDTHLLK